MKKILLTLALFGGILSASSQVVFNEFYTIPASGESEFVEFYNGGAGVENVDAYVMVVWYDDGTNRGFYVLDLPAMFVAPKNVFVGAQQLPMNYQAGTYDPVADGNADSAFSWTNLGAYPPTSYLLDYRINAAGTGYEAPVVPANTNDIFKTLSGSTKYQIFLFKNGLIVNGLSVNGPDEVLATVRSAPDLSLADPDGGGPASAFTITWNLTNTDVPDNSIEYMGSSFGSANGAKRVRDGQCGAWEKSSSANNHTPGRLNGAASAFGSLTVTAVMSCGTVQTQPLTLTYSVEAGGAAEAYPVDIIIYEDFGRNEPGDGTLTPLIDEEKLPNGILDEADVVVHTVLDVPSTGSGTLVFQVDPKVTPGAYTFPFPSNQRDTRNFIVVFRTPQGCFDQIRFPTQCAVLPVEYKSFTASRNRSNVLLKWETSTEENSEGFAIERNNNGVWSEIAFVPSQAVNGSSSDLLTYTYNDPNNVKGITQYRIRQVDFNGRFKYSEIRAVRGEGQASKTVVFPNPTSDGRVSVVFEDGNTLRDVTLIDISGRSIRQWKGVRNNNIQIDNLSAGIYSIRIVERETGAQSVEKIVVNKR